MNLLLQRLSATEAATRGVLLRPEGTRLAYTLERPWADNAADVSCVPPGTYDLVPYASPKHGATWCLDNPALNVYAGPVVPAGGRSYVEIHSANWATQLEGCIALGLDDQPMVDPATGLLVPAVEQSRDAVSLLRTVLGPMTAGHTLTIAGL